MLHRVAVGRPLAEQHDIGVADHLAARTPRPDAAGGCCAGSCGGRADRRARACRCRRRSPRCRGGCGGGRSPASASTSLSREGRTVILWIILHCRWRPASPIRHDIGVEADAAGLVDLVVDALDLDLEAREGVEARLEHLEIVDHRLASLRQPLAGHDGGDAGRIDHERRRRDAAGDLRRSADSRRRCAPGIARPGAATSPSPADARAGTVWLAAR